MSHLFRTKSIDALIAASEEPEKRLRKTLGPWSLTALGIGAVIGSGIFTLTGTAAAGQSSSRSSRCCKRRCSICCCTAATPLRTIGAAGRRSGDHAFVRAGGHRLPLRGAVLRGTGLDDSHRRQRLHVRLRDPGRDLRVDHRLGPDPRIRRLEHVGGGGILGLFPGSVR